MEEINMKTILKNESAQAGVGTLIIFIAMVLVAAVAAAVLIQTSGVMQSKSTSTTKEAAAAIGENIVIEAVDGNYSGTTLTALNITIKVAAGGSSVDLSKVLLKVQSQTYNYSRSSVTASNSYKVYVLRQDGTPLGASTGALSDSANPSLEPGGLARLDVDVTSLGLAQKKAMALALTPEKGTTVNMPLLLPAFSNPPLAIYP
jgi:flagellin FlaB